MFLKFAVEYVFMPDDYNKFVKKAITGDKNAFGELYNFFLDRIYRFIYYLVGDEFLAEDLTQNTFLRAWNGLKNFSLSKGTFQSYLFTIARNLVIDNQRKKKEVSLESAKADIVESGENLEEKTWKNESMNKVHQALGFLEEDDRQIIILRFFEEMHFDEIAEVTGKNSGAIRVKVHRILAVLKKKLEGEV